MDVLAEVEDRVRAGVRERGIDPMAEPALVRDLVDATVASVLAEWSAEVDGPPADMGSLTQQAFSAVAGFGPLQQYFDDPLVEELWIKERLTVGYDWTSAVWPHEFDTFDEALEAILDNNDERPHVSWGERTPAKAELHRAAA